MTTSTANDTTDRDATGSDSILVVIVNYKTADLTIDCVRSLVQERKRLSGLRVVITDNASGDDSIERIGAFIEAERLGDWVELQPLAENGGFAYGNNAAIRPALQASGDVPLKYVLLLNPDTIVRPQGISRLVEFMNANPSAGIAGSRLEDPDGTPQCSAFRFPSALAELESTVRFGLLSRFLKRYRIAPPISDDSIVTDWVAGASMIVRREVFEDAGLLDEAYFMYYEEVDFCLRAKRVGWPCWYVPESHVVHLVGQASGVTNTKVRPKRRPSYWFESRRRYFVKNSGPVGSIACDAAWLMGLACWQLRCLLERKPNDNPPYLWLDSLRESVFCKGFSK